MPLGTGSELSWAAARLREHWLAAPGDAHRLPGPRASRRPTTQPAVRIPITDTVGDKPLGQGPHPAPRGPRAKSGDICGCFPHGGRSACRRGGGAGEAAPPPQRLGHAPGSDPPAVCRAEAGEAAVGPQFLLGHQPRVSPALVTASAPEPGQGTHSETPAWGRDFVCGRATLCPGSKQV